MGIQTSKPQPVAEKNVPEIEEKDIDQDQQPLTFAQLDKRKFLHQMSLNAVAHKTKKLRCQDSETGQNWVKLAKNEDLLIPARVNKIIRVYRVNHHQMNTSINFGIRNLIGVKQLNLEECSNTRNVSFDFDYAEGQIKSEDMRHLGLNVRNNLLHLKNLHLSFGGREIEERGLRGFISALRKHVQLTELKLSLHTNTLMFRESEENESKLFNVICKSFSSIQKLTVHQLGYQSYVLTDKVLVAFGHHISTRLPQLKQLVLYFKFSTVITDDGIKSFLETLMKNNKGLNHLALRFESFISITAYKFNHFYSKLFQAFPDLQNLSLSFSDCDQLTLNEDDRIELKKPSNLTSLELDFERTSISDLALKSLTRHIAQDFPVLQELTLKLAGCKKVVGWSSSLSINEWSKNLTTLRSLNLDFGNCKDFLDMDLVSLAMDIRDGFSALESLSLDFSGHSSFTDKSVENLASAIRFSLKRLKQLTLIFSSCPSITNKGFQKLISKISKLKELKSLSLNFSQHNFTDQSLESLSSTLISDLKNLKQLSLDFSGGKRITNRGVQMLLSTVRKMRILKDLQLSFAECEKLTNEILLMIESIIVQHDFAKANQVIINLKGCSKIDDSYKKLRLNKLGSGPRIKVYF